MSPLLDDFSSFFEDTALGLPGRANTARLDERKVSNLVSKEFLGMVEAVKWGQKHISGLNPQGWGEADIVLIGPSRVDKGAVALELARRGVKESSEDVLKALQRALQEDTASATSMLQRQFPKETLEDDQFRFLMQIRERTKEDKEFELAGVLLDHANPYLEIRGLFLADIRSDDSKKSYRLVKHPKVVAAEKAAALAEGTQARRIARAALQKSVLAESVAAVSQLSAATSSAVWQRLRSEAASKWPALPGRQAADLAIVLALAGCADQSLFEELGSITKKEIDRVAGKSALITMQQIVEKCAAAGYRQCDYPQLFHAGLSALQRLNCPNSSGLTDLKKGVYSLHSERPLRWLFRHATRQGRKSIPPVEAADLSESVKELNSGTQSLVVDLGCGFGVSSLGLAVSGFGVLAVDASAHCVGFARSMAKRWRLSPRKLGIVHADAEQALLTVTKEYLGDVSWVLINFPTPFANLESNGTDAFSSGNSHLPRSISCDDFMANKRMIQAARDCLLKRGGNGMLLVQSNVEDLAVSLRDLAEADGWEAVVDGSLGPEVSKDHASWRSRRQQQHELRGGGRALGPGWLASSPLPRLATTETEAHYMAEQMSIHRAALRPKSAASLNISPYDPVPAEVFTLKPHQVGLITMDERRILKLRESREVDMQRRNLRMLLEPDYASPDRVRKDLELMFQLKQDHPNWPDAVDVTYKAIPETASILMDQVRKGKKAEAK
ncbi:unnamed protein product [Symbiodinium sp. KB8]|nr:unnamed protein product [Symbiodinium sp. KB8]